MLKPGKGKTHRAYMWSWCTTQFHDVRVVVFNFAETRGGQNARDFLKLGTDASWKGSSIVDDFSGYKQFFDMGVPVADELKQWLGEHRQKSRTARQPPRPSTSDDDAGKR